MKYNTLDYTRIRIVYYSFINAEKKFIRLLTKIIITYIILGDLKTKSITALDLIKVIIIPISIKIDTINVYDVQI